ncbi:MAG: ferritin [Erysipelotrichaceae bacterium]|nr:ferritin [Erysipelotrichaceae bacterium]
MINENTQKLLNSQINKEFFSAYLYLGFANWFGDLGLNGFANWYTIQAQEERDHALLFLEYMQNNGLNIDLEAIEKPVQSFEKSRDILVEGLNHEKFVTDSIHTIYEAALENKDYRTTQFLDWFIKEQGEEEKNADDLIRRWDLFAEDSKALYMLDNELAQRVYAAPDLVLS